MTDERTQTGESGDHPEDLETGRIGIFSSWKAMYVTVLVYTGFLTLALYLMTRALDHSGG